MTITIPAKADLTSGTTTEATFQAALGAMVDVLHTVHGIQGPESIAITLDVLNPTSGYVMMDTENAAAADNLVTISPATLGEKLLMLRINNAARVITVKHNVGGTGKIVLNNGVDLVMNKTGQVLVLMYDAASTSWREVYKNWGIWVPDAGGASAARTALGLSAAAITSIGLSNGQIPTADMFGALAFLSVLNGSAIVDGSITGSKVADKALAIAKLFGDVNNKGKAIGYDKITGDVVPLSMSNGGGFEFITAIGTTTWTVPEGVTKIKVYVAGGGRGGDGINSNGSISGPANGGTSSFGSYLTALGGGLANGVGAIGSGVTAGYVLEGIEPSAYPGGSYYYMGATQWIAGPAKINPAANTAPYPGGSGFSGYRPAGAGASVLGFITVTPGQIITATVGAGTPGGAGNQVSGGPGQNGAIYIEW